MQHSQISYDWLRKQAVDTKTYENLETLIADRQSFLLNGQVAESNDFITLQLKHGVITTTRKTGYSFLRVYSEIFANREHQEAQGFKKTDGLIVDIGANEGYYTLAMAKTSPKSKIIAIEPNPIAFRLLDKNIKANQLSQRVHCLKAAVWSKKGKLNLDFLPTVTNISALTDSISKSQWLDNKDNVESSTVHAVTLQDIFTEYAIPRIQILKIDTEGSELEILQATPEYLSKIDRIVVEVHSLDSKNKIYSLLTSHQFKLVMEKEDINSNFDYLGNLYFVNSKKHKST